MDVLFQPCACSAKSRCPGGKVLRDVAMEVGITERAVQNIVADLEAAGVITRFKEGRRNRYKINRKVKLRHAIESHRSVGDLLDFIYKG